MGLPNSSNVIETGVEKIKLCVNGDYGEVGVQTATGGVVMWQSCASSI